ncbi:alpha,alpha-phosphotrehalase [Lactiplantibacillus garii]|uniref:Alpha,alpha-phosphotrehalase n=1 Tax=Lactiplantibacillus garii TaxID=2306423 RepID=A0A3R8QRH6_9LACO|nr:alpha,alpha-phosphotrehalase [Lactiplantibacillus garii]RRK10635.1 alpha,alpha-phosphotrehalase [Lactiplantibacillus garii]
MQLSKQVIYQIYPKSFYDSNGDGVGDLRGIIAKLPYLTQLNIDMIWFNPFYVSPQNDNGYDIQDYYQIDPLFGTMADFEELVQKLKDAGIGVMLDMVFNHTSTAHEWFQKALAGDPEYQKYYYLRPAKADGSLPTNWESKFGGSAWAPFGDTDQYYLHLYDPTQADLDWHNPAVRQACADVINFWQAKGVQGFRFDVINVIGKDQKLVDAPPGTQSKLLYTDRPIVHDYLKELSSASFGKHKHDVTVGELSSATLANSVAYSRPDDHELSMVFNFHHLKTDYDHGQKWTDRPFDFQALKTIINDWAIGMDAGGGWQALFWNNHDQPRAVDRFGDVTHYREKSAEMLATTIHLLRGTPFIYMGEEIGMTNPKYHQIEDYVDVESLNAYHKLLKDGHPERAAFHLVHVKSRDNARTPMQWTAEPLTAGFTTGTPWLKPTNQDAVNVANELAHGEIFNYYQRLITLRKRYDVVSDGDYEPLLVDHPQVLAYIRKYQQQKLVVLNNFYGRKTTVTLPDEFVNARVLISNYQHVVAGKSVILRPYQSVALLRD